jgi:Helix-loop-helix DNA-binding domain
MKLWKTPSPIAASPPPEAGIVLPSPDISESLKLRQCGANKQSLPIPAPCQPTSSVSTVFCSLSESIHTYNCPDQPLYSPTDSIAFSDPSMESYFPATYQPADSSARVDDWLKPAYFEQPNDEDFLSSPAETTLDGSLYVEPNTVDWTNQSTDFVLPSGYQFNRNYSMSTARSTTPDLYDDGEYFATSNDSLPQTPAEDCCSPTKLKRPSPEPAQPEQPVKRKRGRPRIIRNDSDTSESKPKSRVSKRLPHNQVEKKYREGLNNELERLRLAIPTLPQWEATAMNGPPKPSKATVLASAIDYIHRMELERDRLQRENEALRAGRHPSAKLNAGFRRGYQSWEQPQAIYE